MLVSLRSSLAPRGAFPLPRDPRPLPLPRGVLLCVLALLVAASGVLLTAPQASATPLPSIRQVQWNLAGLGYQPLSGVDGINGPRTRQAVRTFQGDVCISVDGIAGPDTGSHMSRQVRKIQAAVGTDQDGAYGPNTKNAVARYERTHGLTADGIADPRTMHTMHIPRSTQCRTDSSDVDRDSTPPPAHGPVRQKIVSIAASQVGVRETAGNCNPYGSCAFWCAMFGTWVWQKAGVNVPDEAFTGAWFNWGVTNGHSTRGHRGLRPGDAVMYGTGPADTTTSRHVDLVEKVHPDGKITVIGGNVDNKVTRRVKDPSAAGIYGYVRP
jgi:peptidoglycan hydrolase-like protein with peptidoglycan-binding domain